MPSVGRLRERRESAPWYSWSLADLFVSDEKRIVTYMLSMLSLVGAAWVTSRYGVTERTVTFYGSDVADPMGNILKLSAYGATALSFLYSREYLQRRGLFKGEYFVLALFALLGVMVMISVVMVMVELRFD